MGRLSLSACYFQLPDSVLRVITTEGRSPADWSKGLPANGQQLRDELRPLYNASLPTVSLKRWTSNAGSAVQRKIKVSLQESRSNLPSFSDIPHTLMPAVYIVRNRASHRFGFSQSVATRDSSDSMSADPENRIESLSVLQEVGSSLNLTPKHKRCSTDEHDSRNLKRTKAFSTVTSDSGGVNKAEPEVFEVGSGDTDEGKHNRTDIAERCVLWPEIPGAANLLEIDEDGDSF
ncbi:hypothetical protein DFH05DRAFT_1457270 [Lentinula detonsa]|uniref:Uncharacterized protein n=1 Tax=Lentinula detonsa TaxID=2804962 RepID=A0A9W8P997_9AGAR|nr:hypothetical protein DFH05DRAFT_1457270 [Lentinula detonsa]